MQPAGTPRPGYVAPPPGGPAQRAQPLPGRGVGFDGRPVIKEPASKRRGVDKRQRYLNRLHRGPTGGRVTQSLGPGGERTTKMPMYGGLTYEQLMGRIAALSRPTPRLPGGRPISGPTGRPSIR